MDGAFLESVLAISLSSLTAVLLLSYINTLKVALSQLALKYCCQVGLVVKVADKLVYNDCLKSSNAVAFRLNSLSTINLSSVNVNSLIASVISLISEMISASW